MKFTKQFVLSFSMSILGLGSNAWAFDAGCLSPGSSQANNALRIGCTIQESAPRSCGRTKKFYSCPGTNTITLTATGRSSTTGLANSEMYSRIGDVEIYRKGSQFYACRPAQSQAALSCSQIMATPRFGNTRAANQDDISRAVAGGSSGVQFGNLSGDGSGSSNGEGGGSLASGEDSQNGGGTLGSGGSGGMSGDLSLSAGTSGTSGSSGSDAPLAPCSGPARPNQACLTSNGEVRRTDANGVISLENREDGTITTRNSQDGSVSTLNSLNPEESTRTTRLENGTEVVQQGRTDENHQFVAGSNAADTSVRSVNLHVNQGDRSMDTRSIADSNDQDCGVSAKLGYSCKSTRATMETARVTNALTQTAGSMATTVLGQSAQLRAMSENTQSAALEGAANTQRTSGTMQMSSGGLNMAMGLVQIVQSSKHKRNGREITGQTSNASLSRGAGNMNNAGTQEGQHGYLSSDSQVAQRVINAYQDDEGRNLNTHYQLSRVANSNDAAAVAGRNAEIQQKEQAFRGVIRRTGDEANREQTAMQAQAQAAGIMSMMTGAQQVMGGGFNLMAAKQLDKQAKALRKQEANTSTFTAEALGQFQNTTGQTGGGGNSITGSGEPDTPEEESALVNEPMPGDLGAPIGDLPSGDTAPGPAAGRFASKDGAAPGGGGGGGGMNVGSTAPSREDQTDPQAKMAATAGGGDRYEGGGGFSTGGGGGVGGGKDPDLSGLLAQFLPKKEEAESNANGILDFGGGRGPASEGPVSLLDRNANIFDRIHDTYQDKTRRNLVGL